MKLAAALVLGLTLVAGSASASTVNVYTPGCGQLSAPALDPFGTPLTCSPTIIWNDTVTDPVASGTVSIVAEGVDSAWMRDDGSKGNDGEFDGFYVNDHFIGYLTQQGFYNPAFRIQPGAGALSPNTALTTSIFDVTQFLVVGKNTFRIEVDRLWWVNEIETATLDTVPAPEPATLLLLGSGLVAGGWRARRRTRS